MQSNLRTRHQRIPLKHPHTCADPAFPAALQQLQLNCLPLDPPLFEVVLQQLPCPGLTSPVQPDRQLWQIEKSYMSKSICV